MSEQRNEVVYLGGEVSKTLGIARSSLTKYCITLENKGYKFIRGSNNSRAFTSKDILLLQRMKDLVQDKSMTMETAGNVVLTMFPDNERTGPILDENKVRTNDVILQEEDENSAVPGLTDNLKYIEDIFNKLGSMEKELKDLKIQNELLQNQNIQLKQTMDESLNGRDENFLSLIHEVQETKKMIASSQEKKWWEFWK
ncbi:DUF3967 domain-containing protein [Priestia endophytica]|uniref:DUF3967 domain-containing protein n=1 Tax=Priestia endophytica TaxID=135735 RepID=UPI00228142DB|nr:DUF3967 domain-containing protein [Priestia endophytica]MCY8231629.1 DUF3967 domain-containing protein [Priestia endophytica]